MSNIQKCPKCENEYSHLLGTFTFENEQLIINDSHIICAKVPYPYRSQSNLHLFFNCEDGHFFFQNFDGCKGRIFRNENIITDDLARFLNKAYEYSTHGYFHDINYRLLGYIEKFFENKEVENDKLPLF